MENDNKNTNGNGLKNTEEKYTKKTYAFVAIGLAAAGAVALGVSFTVLGIYALIASMLFEISAITFVNLQAKKNDLKWLIYVKIVSYVLFFAALLIFVGGTIWSAEKD